MLFFPGNLKHSLGGEEGGGGGGMVSYIHEYGGRGNANLGGHGACPTEIGPNSGVMSNLCHCY